MCMHRFWMNHKRLDSYLRIRWLERCAGLFMDVYACGCLCMHEGLCGCVRAMSRAGLVSRGC